MENQEKKFTDSDNNDADLGAFLNLFVRVCKRIAAFFGSIFTAIGNTIAYVLFFLKRNAIWIGIAVIVGLSYGIYTETKQGSKYEAEMTVRTNFNSTRAMYNQLEYLNALINEHKLKELASIFSITETEATLLLHFSAEPADDELTLTDLYKEKFLAHNRYDLVRMDTFWIRVEKFEDFKRKLTKFDVPLHEITLTSKSADIFGKIQNGVIKTISENDVLKKNLKIQLQSQKEEENTIVSSLEGLDTLRRMYNIRIQKQGEKENPSANLNLIDKDLAIKTPELDLYDKVLQLKDELKVVRSNAADNQSIIQVYAPFNAVGHKVNLLRQNSAGYAIDSIVLVLLLLIIIDIYKAVGKSEKNKKSAQG